MQSPQPMQHTREAVRLTSCQSCRGCLCALTSQGRGPPLQWTTAVQAQQPLFCFSVQGHVSSLLVAAADVSLAMEDSVRVGGLPGVSSSDSEPVPHVLDASDLQQERVLLQDCTWPCAALQPRPDQAPPSPQVNACVHPLLVCRAGLPCHN